jgi:hypothetical protein
MPWQIAKFPVTSVIHNKKNRLNLGKVHDTIRQILLITVGFDDPTNEYVVPWEINRLDQPAFQVDGTFLDQQKSLDHVHGHRQPLSSLTQYGGWLSIS